MEVRLETVTIETTQRHGSDDLEPGEYVRLAVSDSGMGMDEATMDRIFEPFFTTKEVGQGTGLGLSMVHGIVQAHAGLVEVQSSPGEGCMFEIYLPVSTRVEKAETFELPTPEGGNERILFVDDEDMIVELMESMLPALGYKTTCFTNGHAALAALRAVPESFDLLITDLSMPQMNGDQLAEAVKAVAPDLPIIMMTGNNDDFSEAGIETLNVTSMLRKPLRQADLDAAIRRALGGERQRLNIAANQT
jgi:CheY-like chemotaxis protein